VSGFVLLCLKFPARVPENKLLHVHLGSRYCDRQKAWPAHLDFPVGEPLEIDRLRFALERDFGHGVSAGEH
jgi:hypothetical protein